MTPQIGFVAIAALAAVAGVYCELAIWRAHGKPSDPQTISY